MRLDDVTVELGARSVTVQISDAEDEVGGRMGELYAALGVGTRCTHQVKGFGFVTVQHMGAHVWVHHEHVTGAAGRPIALAADLTHIIRGTVESDDAKEAFVIRADATES